ncbi:glycosyltransferase family 2 protein [Dolosigranulum pigrum]|jgi:putative teichoic acid/polysaccharide glycosyl transferase, family 2|nr:glycosyltransferase family 2 protein [Dolosigranulum pigrum]QJS96402.1 glycosyltransferase [Dolosigranulum pigrum]QJS98357.1 glycosyltransferase [Dolosigranulum pigrum]QTJ34688.1 glycosyltransferase [Dolosigranulum pigrum]QTJ39867.1 glycosyltransferase [Dolosigranulum pigrum]QTJ48349.1 glycosyltransferase [Dolosigranulum pigrum]
MMSNIAIVVPCYNEEEMLPIYVEKMQALQKEFTEVSLKLYLVNDGSSDNTLNVMRSLYREFPSFIHYISLSRNFGKEAAMLAGLEMTREEYVAIMDADLQDPPELMQEMYRLIKEDKYDMVGTKRVDRQGEPLIRSWFSNMYYSVNNLISGTKLESGVRDYRLMTRQVVDAILSLPEKNRFSKGIFAWVGFDTYYLPYENRERLAGNTSWSFFSLFSYSLEGFISFSETPLDIASFLGLITFFFALIGGLYIVIKTVVWGNPTPGWPSLAVIILAIGGLQLLSIGILGKYIGKMFVETKDRPHFIIKEQSKEKN